MLILTSQEWVYVHSNPCLVGIVWIIYNFVDAVGARDFPRRRHKNYVQKWQ